MGISLRIEAKGRQPKDLTLPGLGRSLRKIIMRKLAPQRLEAENRFDLLMQKGEICSAEKLARKNKLGGKLKEARRELLRLGEEKLEFLQAERELGLESG